MQAYAQIYAAAAPAMKAQAAADGVSIKIGGPATSNVQPTEAVLSDFLSDPSVAPYVDFVSYHYYPAQYGDVSWDSGSTGLLTQSTDSTTGFAPAYEKIYARL